MGTAVMLAREHCGSGLTTGFTLSTQLLEEGAALFGQHRFKLFALLGRQLRALAPAFTSALSPTFASAFTTSFRTLRTGLGLLL